MQALHDRPPDQTAASAAVTWRLQLFKAWCSIRFNTDSLVCRPRDIALNHIFASETFMTYLLMWTVFFNISHIF